ncbi:unnamed protein product [Orchesella dallaii]|uniref:Uncharacterized protein n=1 Tax=Orchesella dallaii TaxID=48710 RepID=A0ABP1QP10_9HEXA
MFSKAAAKTVKVDDTSKKGKKGIAPQDDKKDAKNAKRPNQPAPTRKSNLKTITEFRDHYHKHFADVEDGPIPVWDRKNEITFYGENYADWEPHVFQTRWEMLHEQELGILIAKSLNLQMKQKVAQPENQRGGGEGGAGSTGIGGKKRKSGVLEHSDGLPKRKSFRRSHEEPTAEYGNKRTSVNPENHVVRGDQEKRKSTNIDNHNPKGAQQNKRKSQGPTTVDNNFTATTHENEPEDVRLGLPKTDEEIQEGGQNQGISTGEDDEGPPRVIQKGKRRTIITKEDQQHQGKGKITGTGVRFGKDEKVHML